MATTTQLNAQSIAVLVNTFYARVRQDKLLGPVFNGAIGDQWPEHLARLTDFWTSVLVASGRYKGNPMMAHLPIPQMDNDHFRRWIELWSETTAELFDPELSQNLVAKALTIGGRLVEVSTRVREAQAAS